MIILVLRHIVQSRHNLSIDGVAGPNTWRVMHLGLQYVYPNFTNKNQYYAYTEGYGGTIAFNYCPSNNCWYIQTDSIDGWPLFSELEVG